MGVGQAIANIAKLIFQLIQFMTTIAFNFEESIKAKAIYSQFCPPINKENLNKAISALKKYKTSSFFLPAFRHFLYGYLVNIYFTKIPYGSSDFFPTIFTVAIFSHIFGIFSRIKFIDSYINDLNYVYQNKYNYDKTSHGSAKFMDKELLDNLISEHNTGLVVSSFLALNKYEEKVIYTKIEPDLSFKHLSIIAPSGAGKTQNYVIPNIIEQKNGSLVVTDPSGELFKNTSEEKKKQGYQILVFEPFSKQTMFYNPLKNVTSMSDAKKLANTVLTQNRNSTEDPFWRESASSLLASIILLLKNTPYGDLASFTNIKRLFIHSDEQIAFLINEFAPDIAKEEFISYIRASEKTRQSIVATMMTAIQIYSDENIRNASTANNIILSELRNKKTILYIVIPENKISYASSYTTLLLQELFDVLIEVNGLPVYLILDEFANLGYIPNFETYITSLRKRKVSFSLILQNIAQLKKLYKENWETILHGGCSSQMFLSGLDGETAKKVSQQLGKQTIRVVNANNNTGQSINQQGQSSSDGKGYSYSSQSRDLLTPDEVRQIKKDTGIFITENKQPVIVNFYPAWKAGFCNNSPAIIDFDKNIERIPILPPDIIQQLNNLSLETLNQPQLTEVSYNISTDQNIEPLEIEEKLSDIYTFNFDETAINEKKRTPYVAILTMENKKIIRNFFKFSKSIINGNINIKGTFQIKKGDIVEIRKGNSEENNWFIVSNGKLAQIKKDYKELER